MLGAGLRLEYRGYLSNPADKSHVPRNIREQVKHKIDLLDDIHHGPRQASLNGAFISRDWSQVPAGDWYQADDCTLPIYYYEPNEEGWFTLWRGQCLEMIELRSTRIIGYALLSSRSYNSLAIRTLITKTWDVHGLPREGFYFERGIWKSSKILTGSQAPLSWAEVEGGLRDLGLRFIHARLPRAKPIEGVLGAVQNRMEGNPGYVGRSEQTDRFERVEQDMRLVASKKLHPKDRFWPSSEWLARLDEIFAQYNAETQDGKMTGGLSPDEAFGSYQKTGDPQVKLDASCRYLLAHHRRPLRVTSNGITLRFGKQVFNYRNEETGRLVGQVVFCWFNPETPEVLCVTDTKCRHPFAVERSQDVPAIDASPEQMKQEMSRIAAHQAPAKSYYRILKAKFSPQFRRNLVDAQTASLGGEFQSQSEEVLRGRGEQQARARTVRQAAERLGIPSALVRNSTPSDERAVKLIKTARHEHQKTLDRKDQL